MQTLQGSLPSRPRKMFRNRVMAVCGISALLAWGLFRAQTTASPALAAPSVRAWTFDSNASTEVTESAASSVTTIPEAQGTHANGVRANLFSAPDPIAAPKPQASLPQNRSAREAGLSQPVAEPAAIPPADPLADYVYSGVVDVEGNLTALVENRC